MRMSAPSLVGRDDELAELDLAMTGARKGAGSAVFVLGEPGIGKSRLVAEAVSRAYGANMVVLRGRGSAMGPMVPFRPLAEALLSIGRTGSLPSAEELGPYRSVLGRLVPEWTDGAAPAADGSLIVLAEAVLRLTSALGRGRGCLLVLEDLHDADIETLAVVEYLSDNVGRQSTLLLATLRDEPGEAPDLARALIHRQGCECLELARLPRPTARELVASCLEVAVEQVPEETEAQLWEHSAGNPFVIEELLHSMISAGQLQRGADGWRAVRSARPDVPATLSRSIVARTDRLGPQGTTLLAAAAVLGRRFPLSIVQRVTGMDNHTLLTNLRAGVATQLLATDDERPDWYQFQHPLTAEVVLAQLTPADRADLSRRAADAVVEAHPGTPGEWCQLVARLRLDAGEESAAARLYTEAGRRALADGAAGSAVALLDRAESLVARSGPDRVDVLEALLYALAEAGRIDRAFQLAQSLPAPGPGVDPIRLATLHVRLAWVAHLAGQVADGLAQIATARALIGPEAGDEHTAPLDAVAAFLTIADRGSGAEASGSNLVEAEALGRRAAAAADRAGLPVIATQAWYVVGTVVRERDLGEAGACFDTARELAERHRLPIWRIYALIGGAGNAWLAESDTEQLHEVRQEALRVGAISMAHIVEAILGLDAVLRGQFDTAARRIDECLASAQRLRLGPITRYALMAGATLAAHRGRRAEMTTRLAEFRRAGGDDSPEFPLSVGLARAFCALLEEDPRRATAELDTVVTTQAAHPTTFYLAGPNGLKLLLDVLSGAADWPQLRAIAASNPGTMRWNRQFVLLAEAILLGRSGAAASAEHAFAEAQAAAAPYRMTQHLALRLVAESAYTDGWGDPVNWLRRAEDHFHTAEIPAVASACRGLLRRFGASVQQRRTGADRVPADLRELGVTVREFEVFGLLAHRLTNKTVADRLHISPRTVEKHVASLIGKTGQPDRQRLMEYAMGRLAQS